VLDVHRVVGIAVLVVAGLAVVAGAVAYGRGTRPHGPASHLLALVQTVLIAQVAIGLLLLSREHRASDELHYLYGSLALGAVLAPWLYAPAEPRRRLLWFVVATLVGGALAARAYLTAP
jgi:hypothetical protein